MALLDSGMISLRTEREFNAFGYRFIPRISNARIIIKFRGTPCVDGFLASKLA